MEHPWSSSAWRMPEVQELDKYGCELIRISYCSVGAHDPVSGRPFRKDTGIFTNHRGIIDKLNGKACSGGRVREPFAGSVGG
eukprot:5264295-Lingulodinium_polyedra.AAC.1